MGASATGSPRGGTWRRWSSTWTRWSAPKRTVGRRLDEADQAATEARRVAGGESFDRALALLDDADEWATEAASRAEAVGPGAVAAVEPHARAVQARTRRARRGVLAERGATRHARAQTAWKRRAYELAADRYDDAVADYRASLAVPGPEPTAEALRRRLRGAAAERAVLSAAPVADAETARRQGEGARPSRAATHHEQALERYRDALGLDWGAADRRFAVDRERCRQRAVAADDAVDAHRRAAALARRRAGAEDRHAEEWYEQARSRLERALSVAREVRPAAVDRVEADLAALPDPETASDPQDGPADDPVDTASEPRTASDGSVVAADRPATGDAEGAAPTGAVPALRAGSVPETVSLVAATLRERGWSVRRESADPEGPALRARRDGTARLVGVVHEPEGEAVAPAAVDQRAELAAEAGVEAGLVTTGTVPAVTRERAAARDVWLVGPGELAAMAGAAGLLDGSTGDREGADRPRGSREL